MSTRLPEGALYVAMVIGFFFGPMKAINESALSAAPAVWSWASDFAATPSGNRASNVLNVTLAAAATAGTSDSLRSACATQARSLGNNHERPYIGCTSCNK